MAHEPLPAQVLIAQNACCGNCCYHCPYQDLRGRRQRKGITRLAPKWQRWIFFDFDGTLADSIGLQLQAYAVLQKKYGWKQLTQSEFSELRKKSIREVIRQQGIPFWRVPNLLAEGQKLLQSRWPEVSLFAGWEDCIPELRSQGFSLGIVTSNTRLVVEQVLARTKIRHHFRIIEAEPKLWNKGKRLKTVVKKLQLNPRQVWYVGDELRDLEAAAEAQIQSVAVGWGLNTPESLQATGVPLLSEPYDLVHWMQQYGNWPETT